MADQYRDNIDRTSGNRGTSDPIRLSFFDKDGTLVEGITRKEANSIALINPQQAFFFQDGNGNLRQLSIKNVNELNVLDVLPDASPCPANPQPCGPPRVEFFGGGGLGAVANTIVSPNSGSIIGFDFVNRGFNYLTEPFANIVDDCGNGRGASLLVQTQTYGASASPLINPVPPLFPGSTPLALPTIPTPPNPGLGITVPTPILPQLPILPEPPTLPTLPVPPVSPNPVIGTTTPLIPLPPVSPTENIEESNSSFTLQAGNTQINLGGTGGTQVTAGGVGGIPVTIGGQEVLAGDLQLTAGGIGGVPVTSGGIPLTVNANGGTPVTAGGTGGTLITAGGTPVTAGGVPLTIGGTGGTPVTAGGTGGIPGVPFQVSPSSTFADTSITGLTPEQQTKLQTTPDITQQQLDSQKSGLEIKNIVITSPGIGYLPAPNGSLGGNGRVWKNPEEGYVFTKDGTYYVVPDGNEPSNLNPGDTFFPPNIPLEIPADTLQPSAPTYPVLLQLDEIYIVDGGFGYQPGDTLEVVPDNGSLIEPVINDRGEIEEIRIINPGLGFIDLPEINVNSDTGFNAKLIPVLKSTPFSEIPDPTVLPPDTQLVFVVDCVGKFNN